MKKHITTYSILICILLCNWNTVVMAQRRVYEYKIKNLISDLVLAKFEQINQEIKVFEHKEGNRLILVGDSLLVETAISHLNMLDVPQMMISIEFMLVEYFHNRDFNWGIDITQGTSGNFKEIGFTPGVSSGDLSFTYNAISKLSTNFHLNVRAMVNEDRAKVLTNPHVAVLSGESANLNIVDRRTIVLETATINGVTTTLQNIEAGIQLKITPVPTHDSLIHLNVDGKVSEFLPFSSSGEFMIEENNITTQVTIRDGQTLIIGGLISEETNTLEGGVPFFKEIPLIGFLFKKKRELKNYVERVMYITPYLHPIENLSEYRNIRKMTPFENTVEQIIEQDPGFLKYDKTKKTMRQNKKAQRIQRQQGNN